VVIQWPEFARVAVTQRPDIFDVRDNTAGKNVRNHKTADKEISQLLGRLEYKIMYRDVRIADVTQPQTQTQTQCIIM
jgi:hypothetical protein